MANIIQSQQLGAEGTISFRLTPVENGRDRLYLLDFGTGQNQNRITLVVSKDAAGVRRLNLEVINNEGKSIKGSEAFPDFKIGLAFDVELVWSTAQNKIAVFVNDSQFIELSSEDIKFSDLGQEVHYGEDIAGEHKTEMVAE